MIKFVGIRTVKTQNGDKNIKIEAFSDFSFGEVSSVLRDYGIILMSFEENATPSGKLYEVVLLSSNGEKKANIIFPVDGKIREAFKYFIDTFGITENIEYIKPYGKEFPKEKLKLILNQLMKENKLLATQESKDTTIKTKKIQKEKEIVLGEKLKKELLTSVEEFISEMEKFLPQVKEIFPVEAKELKDIIGQLKKYKLSTNLYKLSEYYKKALELSESLYDKFFDYERNKENKISTIKVISELEIIAEYKNYAKVQRAKILEKVDAKEFSFPWYETLFYKIFGKVGIHIKLLLQELRKKLEQKGIRYKDIVIFLQFLLIFLVINYTVVLFYSKFAGKENMLLSSLYMILMFSYFGIWISIGGLLKNKPISGILIIILGILSWNITKHLLGF